MSAKKVYEAKSYAAGVYAAGAWRGVGVDLDIVDGPYHYAALGTHDPGAVSSGTHDPGMVAGEVI